MHMVTRLEALLTVVELLPFGYKLRLANPPVTLHPEDPPPTTMGSYQFLIHFFQDLFDFETIDNPIGDKHSSPIVITP